MAETNSRETRPARKLAIVKTLMLALFISGILISGWTLLKYFDYASLPGYIQASIILSVSNFQIDIAIAGLTGLLSTLFLHGRGRSRKREASRLSTTQLA